MRFAPLATLELISVKESLLGFHQRFAQRLNGLPLHGGEVIVRSAGAAATCSRLTTAPTQWTPKPRSCPPASTTAQDGGGAVIAAAIG